MTTVKPIYLIALLAVIAFVVYIKVSNPYRAYSSSSFWENATLASVSEIPEEALKPGNKNGPVLMWAAIGSQNPTVLRALVERGADINEADSFFKGTPLTGAAGYTKNPEMLKELIKLGADINKTVHSDETALMIAARFNQNPEIITTLIRLGSEINQESSNGETALDIATKSKNEVAIEQLKAFTSQ